MVHHEPACRSRQNHLLGSHGAVGGVVVLDALDVEKLAADGEGVAGVVLILAVAPEGEVEVLHLQLDEQTAFKPPLGLLHPRGRLVLARERAAPVGTAVLVQDGSASAKEGAAVGALHDIVHGWVPFESVIPSKESARDLYARC